MANIGTDILSLPTVVGNLIGTEWVPLVQGGTTKRATSANVGQAFFTSNFPASIEYIIFGGGSQIPLGAFGTGLQVPFNCTITQGTLLADTTGSVSLDIWRTTEALYDAGITHPVVGDSITGGNPLTISAGIKVQDSVLSGWTTSLNTGDILWYDVASRSAIKVLTISLKVNRVTGP